MGADMSTDESLSGCSLPEAVATLCEQRASGRLLINLGSARAFFYFDQGELVAARMGPLTGLPAVNLALAMNGTEFEFDPGFELPPRDFKEAPEISLLRQILAPKTRDLTVEPRWNLARPTSKLKAPRPRSTDSPKMSVAAISTSESSSTSSLLPQEEAATPLPKTASSSTSKPASVGQPVVIAADEPQRESRSHHSVYLVSQSRVGQSSISVRASSILLLLAIAAVSITALRSKTRTPTSSGSLSESSTQSTAAAKVTEGAAMESKSALARAEAEPTKSPSRRSSPEPTETPEKTMRAEAGRAGKMDSTSEKQPAESRESESKVLAQKDSEPPAAKQVFQRVPVVIRVENGFVAEAYIKNHQPGLEAYEAAALRIARQRRYPKETTSVETIIVQLATEH